MPSDTPSGSGKNRRQAGARDPSGISKRFGPAGKPEETAAAATPSGAAGDTKTADDPGVSSDPWVPATEGKVGGSADASGRMVHGRYRLIAELGSGGMGTTYRAWDTASGIPVVVKMPKQGMRRDRDAMARFAREIDSMRAVPHESIVPITDSGDDEGCPFVVMRFLPGGSLADYRRRDDAGAPIKNPPGMLHFWLPGVAAALDHIHARGLLHRDVKPGNIFLDGFLKPFLGDFGIAKVVDESGGLAREATLTATQMAVGTPEYMAPEMFKPRMQLNGRVDQYALAVTVYEMLCGEKPFTGSTAHIIVEHSSLPVPPLERRCPGLRRGVCEAVHRALAKTPEGRFSTCGEFAAAVLAEVKPVGLEAEVARLLCPNCRNILKLPRRAAGRSGRCPRCKAAMDVAADLGSLWLEREERGDVAAGGVEADASPEPPFAEVATAKPQRRRRVREWGALAVAACCGLAVGYPWGMSVNAAKARREFREEEVLASKTVVELKTERDELRQAKDALAAENRRLADALTARAARPAEPEAAQAFRPDVQRAANSIRIDLIKIPKGSFMMGEQGSKVEVTLSRDFWLGRTEVTRGQWEKVMETRPWSGSGGTTDADLPALNVSWDDAVEFCRKLTERERASGQLQGEEVYRLPTEAEWEYACRAGTTTVFSFGDEESKLGEFGWFSGNSGSSAHPVGTKQPNPWGLCDMHGNVREWCSDWYAETLAGGVDPPGPAGGSNRVFRGGSWGNSPVYCRSADRNVGSPSYRGVGLGFRVARSRSKVLASKTVVELETEQDELRQAKDALAAENLRLADALAARAARPAEPEAAQAFRPDVQRAANSIGIDLIKIPKGSFMMGAQGSKVEVTLSRDIWLGRTEVTRGQWEKVMETRPWSGSTRTEDADLPAVNVSWDDAVDFCQKLTERERASGQLQGEEVYRLPTEAEWEYACRAGTTTVFSFGDEESKLGEFGWFSGNSGSIAHPVGTKQPNPWGLCDMHGNVGEWCSDWYAGKPTGGLDPVGPAGGSRHVNRGGFWGYAPVDCRSAERHSEPVSHRNGAVGFRVARSQSVK